MPLPLAFAASTVLPPRASAIPKKQILDRRREALAGRGAGLGVFGHVVTVRICDDEIARAVDRDSPG